MTENQGGAQWGGVPGGPGQGWQAQPYPPAGQVPGGGYPPSAAPGWPVPGAQPGGWPATAGPGGPQRRRMVFLALGAAAALAVVALVVTVVMRGGGAGGSTPGAAVKGYLEALSRGDAEAALAFSGDQPGSKEFLSDEVLKKQIDTWPITDIRILGGGDDDGGMLKSATVHVAAKFGDKVSDAELDVKKSGNRWLLDSSVVRIEPTRDPKDKAAKTLTVFGKPVGDGPLYLFPGYQEFASSNPYLELTGADPILLDGMRSYMGSMFRPTFDVNDNGTKVIQEAVDAQFAACRQSKALEPPAPCPAKVNYPPAFVDGTVEWGQPDTGKVDIGYFDPYEMTVSATGVVEVPFTVQAKRGTQVSEEDTVFFSATADISQTPPTLTMR